MREENEVLEGKIRACHNQRFKLFMDCFDVIGPKLDQIYKHLTRHGNVTGGAYLELEDRDHPYHCGVRYSVMAPGNRIRDLNSMSGGERTMAACALLFALVAYRPPPFLILDEVDAHLDSKNVDSLVLRFSRCRSQNRKFDGNLIEINQF